MSKGFTMDTKVAAPAGGKVMGAGENKGQVTGGNGSTGAKSAGMTGKSMGAGYNKGQTTGGSGKTSATTGFAGNSMINGKI